MIYHVFANKSNIGDWLSAQGIQTTLRGHQITELFCDTPFVDETIARLRGLQPDDFVIIGGGGLFMGYFAPFWSGFLKLADSISFGIWGAGVCDLTHEASLPAIDLIAPVVARSRFCYVRDEVTRRYFSKLNLVRPTGCPSLLCLSAAPSEGRGILHVDNYTTVGEHAFEYMDELGCRYASTTDRPYRRTNNRVRPGDETEFAACLELYRDSDVILTSALHGCVIGAALNKKVVAVSGDRKIDSFMDSIGLGKWVCGRDELDELPSLLNGIQTQPPATEAIAEFRAAQRVIGARIQTVMKTCGSLNR